MGLLADVFSWGDKQKRRIRGLLDNPKEELALTGYRSAETLRDTMLEPMNYMTHGIGGLAGTFIGKSAKTWDKAMHGKALQMESAGMDPRAIWKETGNWKGPDGNWRQEIPDDAAKFTKSGVQELKDYGARTEGRIFKHGDLYKAYPDAADVVVLRDRGNDYSGYQLQSSNNIGLAFPNKKIDMDALKDVNLHELQHAIQQREGWAQGGSPEMMATEKAKAKNDWDYWTNVAAIRQEAERLGGNIDKAADSVGELFDFVPTLEHRMAALNTPLPVLQGKAEAAQKAMFPFSEQEAYRRLAGEAEARATQKRMPMNASQRREVFPADSYDVPLDQLIIRGLLE